MNEILVSVIIPTYNNRYFIRQAIDSVLKQSVPLEIIVIDDASFDGTYNILLPYINSSQIIYLKNSTNLGVAKSRNLGIQVAKGKYIAFLDSDDWWSDNKLEMQINLLKKNNSPLCYTGRLLHNEAGVNRYKYIGVSEQVNYRRLLHNNIIACSSVLLLRSAALEFPMEHDELHEDYIMWLSILKKYGNACGIDLPLLNTRLTKGGKSRNKMKSFKMTYGVYRYFGHNIILSIYLLMNHISRSLLRYLKGNCNGNNSSITCVRSDQY